MDWMKQIDNDPEKRKDIDLDVIEDDIESGQNDLRKRQNPIEWIEWMQS